MIFYVVSSLVAFMYGITYTDFGVSFLAHCSFFEIFAEICFVVWWLLVSKLEKAE